MLTADQIIALAPDDSSAKAAKGLLALPQWPTLGGSDAALWGECKGSGSKPYQVMIDLAGPTFKCSCPSRKFPCKHGLALYLLRAQNANAFTLNTAPAWLADWLASRRERAEKQADKLAEKKALPAVDDAGAASGDADARAGANADADQAKREAAHDAQRDSQRDSQRDGRRDAKRLQRMAEGACDLERWLGDLVRHGMADLPGKAAPFWRDAAARMVDAQAPGLANGIRQIEAATHSGEGWEQRALMQMGRVQLLLDALQRFESLPDAVRMDVRTAAGWPLDKQEVATHGDSSTDVWRVDGVHYEENDKLWERRVWLTGLGSSQAALLLDFSHGQRRFEQSFVAGTLVAATLGFFPGAQRLRALAHEAHTVAPLAGAAEPLAPATWEAALGTVANAFASNPWQQRLPLRLNGAVPLLRDGRWLARDGETREAPLSVSEGDAWQLLALSGGLPLDIFGEWQGERWHPLSARRPGETALCWSEGIAA